MIGGKRVRSRRPLPYRERSFPIWRDTFLKWSPPSMVPRTGACVVNTVRLQNALYRALEYVFTRNSHSCLHLTLSSFSFSLNRIRLLTISNTDHAPSPPIQHKPSTIRPLVSCPQVLSSCRTPAVHAPPSIQAGPGPIAARWSSRSTPLVLLASLEGV